MRSSYRRRHRRGRDKPRQLEVEEDTSDWAELPQDAPSAVLRKIDYAPRLAPPNPNSPKPQPHPATPSSSFHRRHRRRGRNEAAEEPRDWAELPLDVLLAVFHRLDHIEILKGVGQVGRSWRRVARDEPELWRRVDMRGHCGFSNRVVINGMAQVAVRRSAGQCEAFWGEISPDVDLLLFLADQAPSLKSLSLMCCDDIDNAGLMEAVKKFPLLEELEILLCPNVFGEAYEFVGNACPLLKRLRLDKHFFQDFEDYFEGLDYYRNKGLDSNRNVEALGIATMHELSSLQLFGNILTNEGLATILDNCPNLESLDILHCFNVYMDDTLLAKCTRIKTLRLPYDSADDYWLNFKAPIVTQTFGDDSDDDFAVANLGCDFEECVYSEYDDYSDPIRFLDGVDEDQLDGNQRMSLF